MKMGIRKPSLKKSIKARTTGKVKRKMKKTVNPFYGKKGMGVVRNPKKAVYNKVYKKTTISVVPPVNNSTTKTASKQTSTPKKSGKALLVWAIILLALSIIAFSGIGNVTTNKTTYIVVYIVMFAVGVLLLVLYISKRRKANITTTVIEETIFTVDPADAAVEKTPDRSDNKPLIHCPYCGGLSD